MPERRPFPHAPAPTGERRPAATGDGRSLASPPVSGRGACAGRPRRPPRLARAVVLAGALLAALLAAAGAADGSAAPAGGASFAPRPAPRDLPADERAQALIADEPGVVQARHALEAARQRARMLAAGPYEWTVRSGVQRRRYRSGAADAGEWSAGLERTLRSGDKAELDRQLGEALLGLSQARLGEARHEAARSLLELWLDGLAAERAQQLWSDQFALAEANLQAVERLRRAGDASMLERNAAGADLAEVQRQLSMASGDAARARARLRARFPALAPPPVALDDPLPLVPDAALWREHILGESDPLRVAQEGLRRAELLAARARADRVADPTVGVHATSEGAGGGERVVGVTLSIPLGGTYRSAQLAEALQQVEMARADGRGAAPRAGGRNRREPRRRGRQPGDVAGRRALRRGHARQRAAGAARLCARRGRRAVGAAGAPAVGGGRPRRGDGRAPRRSAHATGCSSTRT